MIAILLTILIVLTAVLIGAVLLFNRRLNDFERKIKSNTDTLELHNNALKQQAMFNKMYVR